MPFPLWFQDAIKQRVDDASARIERHPDVCKLRAEERTAFNAMFPGIDKMKLPEFMDWEDKHHFRRALENERLYMQGMIDGVQLVVALFNDPLFVSDKPETTSNTSNSDAD
ncbi:MAG: hypothetical protein E7L01_03840 [Paenibacillus macerans]|uniref:Uncharacterized protein n=1 Tax=Paenibacillus macerans TaxID=44252 RepID=A0A090ZNP7_PAEMA|nr:hypothetical protein [Paenibacillus macerans]KFN05791.1 hypothetical protein DJ90_235 [Paenibacillus macerans]MBS5912101.1 hypothetical protein [Paenibacillus macerans]MCY7559918.1 hypothetical protein [Paenibacillus macerans]MDU5945630.1 hypothetical protein [Paenibacillus macerans]MDU7472480.1 hypothetical protein [Paenibacillus macerans]